MPVFLDSTAQDFEAAFAGLLSTKREDSPEVDDTVAAVIADISARGDAALDHLNAWHKVCQRMGWGDPATHGTGREPLHVTAYRHLLEVVDAMEDAIRERYQMPEREEREGLRR